MIYVFYENLPLYDISSHNQKFVQKFKETNGTLYGDNPVRDEFKYDPPLPTSVIHYAGDSNSTYGDVNRSDFEGRNSAPCYDPPLPTSVIKMLEPSTAGTDHAYGNTNGGERGNYDSPLPTSILQFKSERRKHNTQKPTTMMD